MHALPPLEKKWAVVTQSMWNFDKWNPWDGHDTIAMMKHVKVHFSKSSVTNHTLAVEGSGLIIDGP